MKVRTLNPVLQSGAITPEICWRHYAGNVVAPLCRQSSGAITPTTEWLLYAGNSHLQMPLEAAAEDASRLAQAAGDTSHIDYVVMGETVKDIAREDAPHPKLIEAETYTQSQRFRREADKGERKDCKTAYASLSLLAIPFLLFDTVTDTGCKW